MGGNIFLVNMKSGSFFKLIKKCAQISGLVGQKWSFVNFGERKIVLFVCDDAFHREGNGYPIWDFALGPKRAYNWNPD